MDAPYMPKEVTPEMNALIHAPTEDIFRALLKRGNGGVNVKSTAAPALSTQFVLSSSQRRATASTPGSFAELMVPKVGYVYDKVLRKHTEEELFGYYPTMGSDVFPGGYGERSARALSREESTFQLKGVFPSAALAYTKLKARIEAREGNVEAVDEIFAAMWGLPVGHLAELPQLHLAGSEATRMSALEDRAYHSLSAHPSINGGYRVDMATIAADALGEEVPVHWPRVRTSFKAITIMQLQGDNRMSDAIKTYTRRQQFSFFMDLVKDAQPRYQRPRQWEVLFARLFRKARVEAQGDLPGSHKHDFAGVIRRAIIEEAYEEIVNDPKYYMSQVIHEIANLVSEESNRSFRRTIEIILEHDRERAVAQAYADEEFELLQASDISQSFDVPRYKIRRTTLHRGLTEEKLGKSKLPDVTSHGRARVKLDMAELREANMNLPLDISGILNFAVYLTVVRPNIRTHAYQLLAILRERLKADETQRPLKEKLRSQSLYTDASVYGIGPKLFGESFRECVELLLRNVQDFSMTGGESLKLAMWTYLSGRTFPHRRCTIPGDWRDLLSYIVDQPESWTLYYWARRTIGKTHRNVSSGIFAPIAAGQETDLLVAMRKGVQERARSWADYYAGEYRAIVGRLEEDLERRRAEKERKEKVKSSEDVGKYVPPSLRQRVDLERRYDADRERASGFSPQEYERMVECQSKSKFFSQLQVYTLDRRMVIGQSDEHIREMFIEFYHARWYSLQTRYEKAKRQGKAFRLGPHRFDGNPWGDLIEEFPRDISDLLHLYAKLDPRGWTIPPSALHTKLKKSVGEFWKDITNELQEMMQIVSDSHNDIADEQDDAFLMSPDAEVMVATLGVEAIPVHVPSYQPPYNLPQRTIRFHDNPKEAPISIQTEVRPFISTHVDPEVDGGSDDDEDCGILPGSGSSYRVDAVVRPEEAEIPTFINYVSLRTIWNHLGLPQESDHRMRIAFAVSGDQDLDAPHEEMGVGPIILEGDEATIPHRWARRLRPILHILGKAPAIVQSDDMQ